MPTFVIRLLRAALVCLLPALLVACGGRGEPLVQYEGSTLEVAGTAYQKTQAYGDTGGIPPYQAGVVVVEVKPGQQAAFDALLLQLGLSESVAFEAMKTQLGLSETMRGYVEVVVPVGWELQWVAALRAQAPVASAEASSIVSFDDPPVADPPSAAEPSISYIYEGSTLTVFWDTGYAEYPKPDVHPDVVQGVVIVSAKPGQRPALDALLIQLGLSVASDPGYGYVLVTVPAGWEWQWAAALAAQPAVAHADVDTVAFPAHTI